MLRFTQYTKARYNRNHCFIINIEVYPIYQGYSLAETFVSSARFWLTRLPYISIKARYNRNHCSSLILKSTQYIKAITETFLSSSILRFTQYTMALGIKETFVSSSILRFIQYTEPRYNRNHCYIINIEVYPIYQGYV